MLPARAWQMLGKRARLPEFLPFIAYDPVDHSFLLREDKDHADRTLAIGYCLEVPPFISMSTDMEDHFHALLVGDLPEGTTIQFGMIASTRIYRVLDAYKACRSQSEHGRLLGKYRTEMYLDFLKKGIIHESLPVTPRIFRCFLSIRAPITNSEPLVEKLIKMFKTAGNRKKTIEEYYSSINKVRSALADRVRRFQSVIQQLGGSSRLMTADDLIELGDEFLNPGSDERRVLPKYDPHNSKLLRDYLIARETRMSVSDTGDVVFDGEIIPIAHATPEEQAHNKNRFYRYGREHVVRGGQHAVSICVSSWPEGAEHRITRMRDFFGSAFQRFQQVPGKFTFFVTVVPIPRYKVVKEMNAKSFTSSGQADSFLSKINPSAIQRYETYQTVQQLLNADTSVTFCKGAFHGVIFGSTKEEAKDRSDLFIQSINSAGFVAERNGDMNPTVVMASILPMSVGSKGPFKHLHPQTKTSVNWASSVPWVADWPGVGPPTMLSVGRRGGLQTFDVFKAASTFSFIVAGMTGSGKSFFLNELLNSHISLDEDVFVSHIDYGASAARVIKNLGGRVIDVVKDRVVFNPFANIKVDEHGNMEDLDEIEMLNNIFVKMAHPGDATPEIDERRLIEEAIVRTVRDYGNESTVDLVQMQLEKMRKEFARNGEHNLSTKCSTLAYVLNPYCHRKQGRYSRFFHGRNSSDVFDVPISSLELESLGDAKDLISVLVNTHISNCFQRIRTLPRDIAKFFLIDEAWRLMADPAVAEAGELGVRTFRKRKACFGVLTQSLADLIADRPEERKIVTGPQIFQNAEYRFVLMQKPEAVISARRSGFLNLSDDEWNLMMNLQKEDGVFSEIFYMTNSGNGVSRLIVDRFSYFMYSTKGDEVEMMERLKREQGMDDVAAAAWMAENYR